MLRLTKSFTPGGSHQWITYTYSQRLTVQSFKSRTPLRYQNISIFALCTRLQFEHQQYRYLTPKNHTYFHTYNSNIKYKLSNIVANLILRGTAKPYQTHSRQFYRTVLLNSTPFRRTRWIKPHETLSFINQNQLSFTLLTDTKTPQSQSFHTQRSHTILTHSKTTKSRTHKIHKYTHLPILNSHIYTKPIHTNTRQTLVK